MARHSRRQHCDGQHLFTRFSVLLAFFLAGVGAVLGLDDRPYLARKRAAAVLTNIGFVCGLSVFLAIFLDRVIGWPWNWSIILRMQDNARL